MIIVKIHGGLGNQMFQYAFALQHLKRGKEVWLETSFFEQFSPHQGFELNKLFNISIPILTKENKSTLLLKKESLNYINEIKLKIEWLYVSDIFELDDCYFEGYWQANGYLKGIKRLLHNIFKLEIPPSDEYNYNLKKEIQKNNSVSVHIRRGDYVGHCFFNTIPIEFYLKAINIIQESVPNPVFYIFCDNIKWAEEAFPSNNNKFIFVSWNTKENSYKDMQLMSLCKHNIIANSTFSWWGAYLNKNSKKIVIAPHNWTKTERMTVPNIALPTWITV